MTKAGKVILGVITAVGAFFGIRYFMRVAPEEYVCPYCGESFSTLEELQEHVATQHPGERIPVKIKWE